MAWAHRQSHTHSAGGLAPSQSRFLCFHDGRATDKLAILLLDIAACGAGALLARTFISRGKGLSQGFPTNMYGRKQTAKMPFSATWHELLTHLAVAWSAGVSGMVTSHMQMWQSCPRDTNRYVVPGGAASSSAGDEGAALLSTSMLVLPVALSL